MMVTQSVWVFGGTSGKQKENQASETCTKVVDINIIRYKQPRDVHQQQNGDFKKAVIYSNERKQSHKTMDEPHNIEQKKPDTKEYIL